VIDALELNNELYQMFLANTIVPFEFYLININ
jgi:hypothetical protein